MYFFWVEDVVSGYSNYLGGQSLRSGKLISNNGKFDSRYHNFHFLNMTKLQHHIMDF